MSTRATIKVIGKDKNPVWIYHHTDGYPECVGVVLKERLLKEGSSNFYTIVNDILHIDIYYELTSDQHGDENYAYLVDTDNRILKCYRVGWDEFDWKEEKVEFEFKF